MLRFKNKFVLIWPSSHEYCISVNHVSLIMAARVSAVQYYVWSTDSSAVHAACTHTGYIWNTSFDNKMYSLYTDNCLL